MQIQFLNSYCMNTVPYILGDPITLRGPNSLYIIFRIYNV